MKIKRPSIHANYRWILGFAFSMILVNLCPAGEFTLDGNTLLMAHFNEKVYEADYANGWSRFGGMGAHLTEGYYGKAADLRGIQFVKDFLTRDEPDNFNARFDGFRFFPYANVDLNQGTYECWFKIGPPGEKQSGEGSSLIDTYVHYQIMNPDKSKGGKPFKNLEVLISTSDLRFCLPLLPGEFEEGRVQFKNVDGFKQGLSPEDWHHFALCWSRGELVMYLDGRALFSTDMSKHKGLAFTGNPMRWAVQINGIVLDELRISDVVRHEKDFEPAWRDGQRPAYAFPGLPGIKRYPALLELPAKPASIKPENTGNGDCMAIGQTQFLFDRQTGYLKGLGFGSKPASRELGGLLLWEGLERAWVPAKETAHWQTGEGRINFTQKFANQVVARHAILEKDGAIHWTVTLKNGGEKEAWLEPLMSVPLPFEGITEYFDGSFVQTRLAFPRRRDEYVSTMPFAAAAGKEMSLGVGLDPHDAYSALVSEWIPAGSSGTIRQGTKVALSPGEEYTYTFFLFSERADFGVLSALERYHDLSPDLYRLIPDVPVYSYLPTAEHDLYMPLSDFWRQTFVGGLWGHGPYHTKGDEFGTPRWWDNPKYYNDLSYTHAMRMEQWYGPLGRMRELIRIFPRRTFENSYPVRRFHYCPDLTSDFVVKDLWPGYQPEGDPLAMAHYYLSVNGCWFVNEYLTPIGAFHKETTRLYWRQMAPYSPGFINDVSHDMVMRHADPIAQKTPGRAFSRDKGTYVLGHCGRMDRYRMINSFVDNGHRASIWSDGGWISYIGCAYSSANAIEGVQHYVFTSGQEPAFVAARYMLGAKPSTILSGSDAIGKYFSPETFTPETLRNYYRYCDAHQFLFGLKHGITFCPTHLLGRQELIEYNPILIESLTLGRQTHPGGWVAQPLWMVRGGRGLESLMAVGNQTVNEVSSDIRLLPRAFGGSPLFGAYFGGETSHVLSPDSVTIEKIRAPSRGIAAFKCLGLLSPGTTGRARAMFTGDGLSIQTRLELDLDRETDLTLSTFAPMYTIAACTVNGKPVTFSPGEALALAKGRNTVEISLKNAVFDFDAKTWESVALIKGGKANFCLVADKGYNYSSQDSEFLAAITKGGTFPLGFERGTAMMLNHFIAQYDWEDGVLGNLPMAPIVEKKTERFDGWTVILKPDSLAGDGKVRIDAQKQEILFTGRTQGQLRRTMVMFLHLMDRKYPHVGAMIPLQNPGDFYSKGSKDPVENWVKAKETKEFFGKFADKDFLLKPLLKPEWDNLYANGNREFSGKYTMRFAPYIFEPTYMDTFVYGYEGSGIVETADELRRGFRPEREAFEKKKNAEEQRKKEAEAAEKAKKK